MYLCIKNSLVWCTSSISISITISRLVNDHNSCLWVCKVSVLVTSDFPHEGQRRFVTSESGILRSAWECSRSILKKRLSVELNVLGFLVSAYVLTTFFQLSVWMNVMFKVLSYCSIFCIYLLIGHFIFTKDTWFFKEA